MRAPTSRRSQGRAATSAPGQPPASRPSDAGGGVNAALEKAVQRLEETVDQETAALRSRQPTDFNEFNNRKSQGLLELDRALKMLGNSQPNEAVKDQLRSLRRKLETNRVVLQTHLEAVREVTVLIADALRNAESDGTYSVSFRSKGPEP
jgi:hypothetical protein